MRKLRCLVAAATVLMAVPLEAQAQTNPYVRSNGRVRVNLLNRDCEGPPAYSVQWAGFAATASAEISADGLKKAHKALAPYIADGATISAQGRAAFVRANSGAYASDAYYKVVHNYFCRLSKVYPEKATQLAAAEIRLQTFFSRIYVYQQRTPAERAQFEAEQMAFLAAQPSILTASQVTRAVSRGEQPVNPTPFNYNVITKFDIYLKGRVADLFNAQGCGGTAFASLEAIDTRVLNGLQSLRSTMGLYLSGQVQLAAIPWLAAPNDIYLSPLPAHQNLSVTDLVCVDRVAQDLIRQDEAAPVQPAAPGNSPATPPATPTPTPTPAGPGHGRDS